ncbi:pimeloyl-ACP methyl ester carboxylesterase [Rhizobium laguerreae]
MPAMPFGHAFQSEWERHFTIVHWDQRLTGKTLCANGIETGLVLNDFAEDGVDLVRQLQQRFPGRPIGLVGHSWGTAVAIRMLQAAPELFAGYLAIGQVSDFLAAERYGYETVLAEARRRGAAALITSLNRFPNYPAGNSLSHASLSAVRAAEVKLGFGHYRKQSVMLKLLWLAFVSPDYRWRDLLTLANSKAQSACLDIALAELPQFVVRAAGVAIQCPVLMVGGAFDLFTPTPAAREFFETIHAPQKKLLEGGGTRAFRPVGRRPTIQSYHYRRVSADDRQPCCVARSIQSMTTEKLSSDASGLRMIRTRRSSPLPERHAHLHRQWPQAEPGPRANAVELLGYNTPKSPLGGSGRSERL